MSKSTKSIVVISAIALVCGLLLAVIHQLTKPTGDELLQRELATLQEIHQAEYEVIRHDYTITNNSGNQLISFEYFFKAKNEDYYIIKSSGQGYGGPIEVYVSISQDSVVNLYIGSHSETPGIFDSTLDTLESYYLSIDKIFKLKAYGGDIDVNAGATATGSNRGIAEAVDYAVQYYIDYTGEEQQQPDIMEILKGIYDAEYEVINYNYTITQGDSVKIIFTHFYKAVGEDYYIIISKGDGHSVISTKGNDTPVQVYVSISGDSVVDINIGDNAETADYLSIALENKEKFLLPLDSNFKVKKDGGDVDEAAGATHSSMGISEALAYAADYFLDYTGNGISAIRLAKLKEIHDAEYEVVKYSYTITQDDSVKMVFTHFYKAVGEDYYIIISKGDGHSVLSARGNNTPVQVYVSISGDSVVDINIGNNAETAQYLSSALENKENFLLPLDSNFKIKEYGGDVDEVTGATNSSRGITEAIGYAADYFLDYTGNGISAIRLAKLKEIHDAQYEAVKYSYTITQDDSVKIIFTHFYKAVGEDYYIIISKGDGHSVLSTRGNDTPVQVYVSISGDSVVDINIGDNAETAQYLSNALENKENFLLPLDSNFKIKEYGGDVDAVAEATNSSRGITEAIGYAAEYFLSYLGER